MISNDTIMQKTCLSAILKGSPFLQTSGVLSMVNFSILHRSGDGIRLRFFELNSMLLLV